MEESTSFTTSIHIASFAVFRYVSVCLLRTRKHIILIDIFIDNIPNWNDQFHKSEKFDPEIASPTVCSGPSLGDYLSHDIMDDFAHLWNLHFFELSRCKNGDVWRVLAAMLVARQAWRPRNNFTKSQICKTKLDFTKNANLSNADVSNFLLLAFPRSGPIILLYWQTANPEFEEVEKLAQESTGSCSTRTRSHLLYHRLSPKYSLFSGTGQNISVIFLP